MYKTGVILVNYDFGGSVMTVSDAKSSAESGKFTLKIRSESEKLFTNGCHFPPKTTNFGTLRQKANVRTLQLKTILMRSSRVSNDTLSYDTDGVNLSVQGAEVPGADQLY